MITDVGERALAEIINLTTHGSTYRWDIDRLIATFKDELSQTAEGHIDMTAITTWYIQGRHRRFAAQHECNYGRQIQGAGIKSNNVVMKETKDSFPLGGSQRISPPADFLSLLRRLPAEDFRTAMIESYSNLEIWWSVGDPNGLRRALDIFYGGADKGFKGADSYLDFAQLFVNFGATLSADSNLVRAGAASLALISILNISRRAHQNLAQRDQKMRIIECASRRASVS